MSIMHIADIVATVAILLFIWSTERRVRKLEDRVDDLALYIAEKDESK